MTSGEAPAPTSRDGARAGRPPSLDRLLGDPAIAPLIGAFGRSATLAALRETLAEARRAWHDGAAEPNGVHPATLAARCETRLRTLAQPSLRPVFNLTGTVLHTNLGRALLPEEACLAVSAVLSQASNLEFDLDAGGRGERDDHIEALVCRLTGAPAATIVNNNAAAVLIVLNTLALRREVLVSRGELVEIGGAFRIPDVMGRAGSRLVEVGTTNRTHLKDYVGAIGARTAMALKVHASNYAVQGFTAAVGEQDLAALCRERGLVFAVDLGSGSLVDLAAFGLPPEPTVRETLAHADVVTFSGDKLLGGVQCGLIVGARALIDRIRRNPLKRALRVDKMTLAAMEAVLRLYLHPERLAQSLPTLRLLTRPAADIEAAARRLRPLVANALGARGEVGVAPCRSQIGSGAMPIDTLASFALTITPLPRGRGEGTRLQRLAAAFRALPVPVIGRVEAGALRLDLRTLDDEPGFVGQLADLSC